MNYMIGFPIKKKNHGKKLIGQDVNESVCLNEQVK